MPSSGVLTELADPLGGSVGYMAGDREMAPGAVEFRKEAITSKREEVQVKARVLHMLGRHLVVEELLGLPGMEWDKPRKAPYPVFSHLAEAARRAHALQDHWGLGIAPIPDLVETLEGRGVKALSGEFKRRGGCDPPCTEPFPIPEGEKPGRFERLCLRALAEGQSPSRRLPSGWRPRFESWTAACRSRPVRSVSRHCATGSGAGTAASISHPSASNAMTRRFARRIAR